MTTVDGFVDYDNEPAISDELEIARRSDASANYAISISPADIHHTGTANYELLLTETQASSVRNGVYLRNDASRLVSMLNQYHNRNSQITMARSEGGENFNISQLARALIKVLENPQRIILPPGSRLDMILKKSG